MSEVLAKKIFEAITTSEWIVATNHKGTEFETNQWYFQKGDEAIETLIKDVIDDNMNLLCDGCDRGDCDDCQHEPHYNEGYE